MFLPLFPRRRRWTRLKTAFLRRMHSQKDSGVKDGLDLAKNALSSGDGYGMSESQLNAGFDQTDYDQAAADFLLNTGRVPTQRIDA